MDSLPDLPGDQAIVADNIFAAQTVWFAWQLERMRVFDVADRIVALSQQGLLPLGQGRTGRSLLGLGTDSGGLSAAARQQLLCRTFNLPAGKSAERARRSLEGLWLQFISTVVAFERVPLTQRSSETLTPLRRALWQAARALAVQLSAWGGGGAHLAAKELAREVNRIRDLLETPAVLKGFGACDMWAVIDHVTRTELSGPSNTAQYRQRAVAGSTLLQWLAEHVNALKRHPEPPADIDLTNAALRDAVAQWLALAGNKEVAKRPPQAGSARRAAQTGTHQLTSRYLGETEKSLVRLFDQAKGSGAMLLFDEGDSLLGRRAEVSYAHDRYAAVDVDVKP